MNIQRPEPSLFLHNRTTMKHILLILSLLSPLSAAVAQTPEYLKGIDERVRYITSRYDTSGGYYGVAARYEHNVNLREADSMFVEYLKKPAGDMFWMFPVIGTYLHGKDKMSMETKAAVRAAWKNYAPYRGDTENHWAMYYSTLFLASECWPGEPGTAWYNGKSSDENREDAKGYLRHWMHIATTIGQGEFDSPDYFAEYAISMCLLADYAQDPEMKQRGKMMMDYILADFAAEHLDGQYLGGFSRIYEPQVYRPLTSTAAGFAYLYFGTGEPTQSAWVALAALGTYRPPTIIVDIALDRTKSYVHRERKRVRNVIRFGDELNPPVYKYTYVTKDYGIGSLQGGLLQPIQIHTWGVRYQYGRPISTIFGLHPYWSTMELGMFFPEEIKPLLADVVASKGTYDKPDKWTGGSPYERVFQHRNTLIALYDIAPGTNTEHIDGFFPGNLEQRLVDQNGWILCKAGDTYVAWYPLQDGVWSEEHDADKTDVRNFRFRSNHLQNGYVVEVRSKDEIGSFEKFCAAVKRLKPTSILKPGTVSVTYTTLAGERMSFGFPGKRMLNGKAVDLSATKLFDGPFLQAEVGSEKLLIKHGEKNLLLDFSTLTVSE